MRVALTGASGLVGQAIADALAARGDELVLLCRPGGTRPGLPAGARIVEGDLGGDIPAGFLEGADALIHAAFAHEPGRYRRGQGDDLLGFLSVNLMGSLRLLETARRLGVGRAVLLSSRAVYAERLLDGRLDERHPALPDSHYGALKLALEAFARAFAHENGWPVAALRPTGVYGIARPFARTKWLSLVEAAMAGREVEARVGSEVHADDVAAAICLLLDAPVEIVAGQVFNCSDRLVSTRELVEIVQHLTGAKGPLPALVQDPAFIEMDSSRLESLGLRFGGRPRLEATLAAICARLGSSAA